MKEVTQEIVEKALSMRRDFFTIQESAELLGVRAEELMACLKAYVEGDGVLPPVKETTRVKPDAKPKAKPGRKKNPHPSPLSRRRGERV